MAGAGEVSFVERHVEKGVLLVCVLLFIYVLFSWGLSSPRELDGKSPEEIDAYVKSVTDRIKRQMERAEPNYIEPEDLTERFLALQAATDIPQSTLVAMGLGMSPIRLTELPRPEWSKKSLKEDILPIIPAPSAPLVWAGRELPEAGKQPVDTEAAHVVMVYPWGELKGRWRQAFEGTAVIPQIVALGVESQYRVSLGGDRWGAWKPVRTSVKTQNVDGTSLSPLPAVPAPNTTDPNEVLAAVQVIEGKWQTAILQPEFWDIWWPGKQWVSWRVHLPKNPVSNPPVEISEGTTETAPPAGRPKSSETTEGPVPTPVPPLNEQIAAGKVLVWFHTTDLESGRTYQFRGRLVLVNPLLAKPDYAEPKSDADVVKVYTPWSPPSRRVFLPKATEFFVVGYSENIKKVSVAVFAQCLGQTVRRSYSVGVGEAIGRTEKEEVVNPVDGTRVVRQVDFSTGAVMVSYDFNKRIRRGRAYEDTAEAVYLDEQGQLHTRIESLDRNSEKYKQLRDEARAASRATRDAPEPAPASP